MAIGNQMASEMIAHFDCLVGARALAESRIESSRKTLGGSTVTGLDVVAFGSLARKEVTAESDFDYLVLATNLPDDPKAAVSLLAKADNLRFTWATETGHATGAITPPGASGVFAQAVGAFELVHHIGLQADTNHSLTRRMLLLEESVSLMNPTVRTQVLRAVLSRYLELGETSSKKVPRFLLNDVTRYWHTITVDYQAKARFGPDESGLRYLKLIISRKVLYAGTLMSLLLCGEEGHHDATVNKLLTMVIDNRSARTPVRRRVDGKD
jgi:hypothetical protein